MPPLITVYEVGPRDGLQNEVQVVTTEGKLRLLRLLADAGLSRIEATSFVSPRWVPALADASEVVSRLPGRSGLAYVVLVPNAKGLERLLEALARAGPEPAQVDAAVFLSASETHNRKNVNKSIDETFAAFDEVIPPALSMGLRVRGYVSTAWRCPYEGTVAPERVAEIALRLLGMGCYQVSLGDTIGAGTPNQTRRLLEGLLARARPGQLALHMHDTRGTALANVLVGLEAGLTTFDASVGGLGGCPYAPGASGNLATEDLVYMLHGMGYETGIDWPLLIAAGELAQKLVGRKLPGKALQAELAARTLLAEAGASTDDGGRRV
jgi:hydroxymethylglutaryl-CoA lyase